MNIHFFDKILSFLLSFDKHSFVDKSAFFDKLWITFGCSVKEKTLLRGFFGFNKRLNEPTKHHHKWIMVIQRFENDAVVEKFSNCRRGD